MNQVQQLYEKLWKSLIRPARYSYSESDLGASEISFDGFHSLKMDFLLQNNFDEKFHLTLYLPCDEKHELLLDCKYILYAHTHSGCRTEGLFLVDEGIRRNIGIALFDFRANGYSSG